MNTPELIQTREASHGKFEDNAALTVEIMECYRKSPHWNTAPPTVKVAVYMIVHKMSRALSGSVLFDDHWKDVQGYASLVENICPKQK